MSRFASGAQLHGARCGARRKHQLGGLLVGGRRESPPAPRSRWRTLGLTRRGPAILDVLEQRGCLDSRALSTLPRWPVEPVGDLRPPAIGPLRPSRSLAESDSPFWSMRFPCCGGGLLRRGHPAVSVSAELRIKETDGCGDWARQLLAMGCSP